MTDSRVPVLLYDGECGLCNAVVRFLLGHDTQGRLRFAPLQSSVAQEYLRAQGLPTDDFESLVFVPDWSHPVRGAYLLRTDGVLATFAELDGPWGGLARLKAIPRFFRDFLYKLVAKTRYAIFGEYRPRPFPDPAWASRFLDH